VASTTADANPALPLTAANLVAIAARGISVPAYDRGRLSPRIVHVGVGGFHRAHLARYTDELAAQGGDWAIRGVGLLPNDERIATTLRSQDHLYTLVARDMSDAMISVVGSIVDFVFAAGDQEAFSRIVGDPNVAILSLTITEGGYSVSERNPTIEAIVSALESRFAAGVGPLTILSCDNLPGNGDAARDAILRVASERRDPLATLLEASCSFPNSMVDRITPQTTEGDRTWLRQQGIDDGWPVVCESFRQWVIEDEFAAGRPTWEDVGALFTDRVHNWELYKLRMLNASHSCMAYLSALAGVEYVDEAIGMPEIATYLRRFLATEAIPTLDEIPGHPAADYAESIFHRLANTGIRDQIARLCIDGTAKFPSFLLPTVAAQLDQGGPVNCAALACAAWAGYLATTPAAKRAPDPHGDEASELARRSLSDPATFLELDIFTGRIRESERFRDAFTHANQLLAERGPLGAMKAVTATDASNSSP
jgi:mannitol 2-dehydrogenase